MTSTKRQGIADAFKACLPYLWNGLDRQDITKTSCICFALYTTKHTYERDAQRCVASRLGSAYSVRTWLIAQGVPIKDITNVRLQAHRKAWVEQLIKEFST